MTNHSADSQGGPSGVSSLQRQLSLVETVIVLLASCSLVIFVFTIGARFLQKDTFDKLPDFLKNSYSALWAAGVTAGGALAGSVANALSRQRRSTKGSFILYILVTTTLIMILIVGTIGLSLYVDEPRFVAPAGATTVSLKSATRSPVEFYLQNRYNYGNPGRIRGTYQLKDGIITGEVANSELETDSRAAALTWPLTSMSVHLCYFAIQNHMPFSGQIPQFPVSSNSKAISTAANMQQPFTIPNFTFEIDTRQTDITYLAPPYLCAFVDGPNASPHFVYY